MLVHHAAADNPISVVIFHDPHESKSLQLSLCFWSAGAKEIMLCGNNSFPPVLIEGEAAREFSFRPLNKLAAAKTHRAAHSHSSCGALIISASDARLADTGELLCAC